MIIPTILLVVVSPAVPPLNPACTFRPDLSKHARSKPAASTPAIVRLHEDAERRRQQRMDHEVGGSGTVGTECVC